MNSLGELAKNLPEHQFDNPWLAKAGMFADDPTWDDFIKVMADYRWQLIDYTLMRFEIIGEITDIGVIYD
jgi:hypothetical protein